MGSIDHTDELLCGRDEYRLCHRVDASAGPLDTPLQGMIRQVLLVDSVEEPPDVRHHCLRLSAELQVCDMVRLDRTVRGDTEFPMAFALNANPLELNDAPFVATYGVLSGHLQSSIDTESQARVVVIFRKDE